MKFIVGFFSFGWLRVFDFLAPLVIRLFLAPILWVSGVKLLGLFSGPQFVAWNPSTWANPEAFRASVASIPVPSFMGMDAATLVIIFGIISLLGAILLILGLGVRWITLALIFMVVAQGLLALGHTDLVAAAKQFIMGHGYYDVTNNAAEGYILYLILLVSLFFMGAGRWFSLDWYIYRSFVNRSNDPVLAHQDPFEVDTTDEPGIQSYK